MASGVPIICSDAQGNTEVLNENEAWIFKRGSPTSLAETLILANCNEKQSKSKAKNAFIKVKTQFDWSVVSQKYYEFFEGLVQ
jgi:Glycosyltransferase